MPTSRKRNSLTKKKASFQVQIWDETESQRQDRLRIILDHLHAEYPDAACELNYSSPWELLVATILSAQSTDVRVNKETPALFAAYPNVHTMAEASQEEVEELVRRTGFFRNKARSIRETANTIVNNFDGALPSNMDDLLTLRGVARKTANVVLGTAFGIASGVTVDTHVKRLSRRLGLSRHDNPEKIEQDLMKLMPKKDWIFAGHAIIWHGRRICDAKRPICEACALNALCPSAMTNQASTPD